MRAELRKEMLRLLKEHSRGETVVNPMGQSDLTYEALHLLREHGALEGKNISVCRITISGYDYYQQLKAPRKYWAKKNWFPVSVLIVSGAAPIVAILIADWLR